MTDYFLTQNPPLSLQNTEQSRQTGGPVLWAIVLCDIHLKSFSVVSILHWFLCVKKSPPLSQKRHLNIGKVPKIMWCALKVRELNQTFFHSYGLYDEPVRLHNRTQWNGQWKINLRLIILFFCLLKTDWNQCCTEKPIESNYNYRSGQGDILTIIINTALSCPFISLWIMCKQMRHSGRTCWITLHWHKTGSCSSNEYEGCV